MSVRLILGDCLEKMAEIESGSVDAIIADPPFGTTQCAWDKAPDWSAWWPEARRVCKPDAFVVLFTAMPAALDLIAPARKHFRYDLVAHKNLAVGHFNANKCPMRNHELIWVFAFGKPKWNRIDRPRAKGAERPGKFVVGKAADSELYGRVRARTPYAYSDMECPKSVFPMIRVGNTNSRSRPYHHPTAKPLPTMEWLVSSYSDEGSTVLDCWMGSGTTGDACINTGRSFVGIDDKPAYFAAASDRIAAAESATPLLNHAGAASP